jgi:hypothetical protein
MKNIDTTKKIASAFVTLAALCVTTQASAVAGSPGNLIINEYNAVGPAAVLADCPVPGPADPIFGCATGNGGNWIELVVTTNLSSIVGWKVSWENDDSGGHVNNGTITFKDTTSHGKWNNLKAGTIITVRSGDTNDLSYNPCAGASSDYWIRVSADDTTYITQNAVGSFKTDNDCWNARIQDNAVPTPNVIQNWMGEDTGSCNASPVSNPTWAGSGVGNDEVGKLEANPVNSTSNTNYNDGDCSTFGAPNCWSNGLNVQSFDALCDAGCGVNTNNCK